MYLSVPTLGKIPIRFKGFSNGLCSVCLHVDDFLIIYLYKHGEHRYSVKGFFYSTLFIFSYDHIRSKRQLLDVVQYFIDHYSFCT